MSNIRAFDEVDNMTVHKELIFNTIIQEAEGIFQSGHIEIPYDYALNYKENRIKRVVGTINQHPFRLAFHYNKKLDFYFLLTGHAYRKAANIDIGQSVLVQIKPDPEPDAILLPEEFEEYLFQDEEAKSVWDELLPGMQRSLAFYISTGKMIETRIKRSIEMGNKLKRRDLDYFKRKNK